MLNTNVQETLTNNHGHSHSQILLSHTSGRSSLGLQVGREGCQAKSEQLDVTNQIDLDGTNYLDDSLHDGIDYYEGICELTSRISKVLYCSCFVASIIYFCFQLFASTNLF
jgi:hypothetical protein